jgi:hypothetical protein
MKVRVLILSVLAVSLNAFAGLDKIEPGENVFEQGTKLSTSGELSQVLMQLIGRHSNFKCSQDLKCTLLTPSRVSTVAKGSISIFGATNPKLGKVDPFHKLFVNNIENKIRKINENLGYKALSLDFYGGNDHCGSLCMSPSTNYRVDISGSLLML